MTYVQIHDCVSIEFEIKEITPQRGCGWFCAICRDKNGEKVGAVTFFSDDASKSLPTLKIGGVVFD